MTRWLLLCLVLISSPALSAEADLKPGDVFKDCETCPELAYNTKSLN